MVPKVYKFSLPPEEIEKHSITNTKFEVNLHECPEGRFRPARDDMWINTNSSNHDVVM